MGEENERGREDRRLIGLFLKTRDEECFRTMYRRHSPALYLMALRLAGGAEPEARDLVQETWIRACRALPEFQHRSSLRTWLKGILVNRFREVIRSKQRDRERTIFAVPAGGPLVRRSEMKIDLERAIARLPDGYREVLILHDLEGFTHEEIGNLLKIESGTSKSQLFHARKSLIALFSS